MDRDVYEPPTVYDIGALADLTQAKEGPGVDALSTLSEVSGGGGGGEEPFPV